MCLARLSGMVVVAVEYIGTPVPEALQRNLATLVEQAELLAPDLLDERTDLKPRLTAIIGQGPVWGSLDARPFASCEVRLSKSSLAGTSASSLDSRACCLGLSAVNVSIRRSRPVIDCFAS
jgi:hypothetical protein